MCGVFGMWAKEQIGFQTQLAMYSLQHRGQDACGVLSFDTKFSEFSLTKGEGTAHEVLRSEILDKLKGPVILGHTRYPTSGTQQSENILPLLEYDPCKEVDPSVKSIGGIIAISYNGHVANSENLKKILINEGEVFKGNSDSELVLKLLKYRSGQSVPAKSIQETERDWKEKIFFERVKNLFERTQSPMSVVGIHSELGFFAFRDPLGLRPLCASINSPWASFLAASESTTLESLRAKDIFEVNPGELIIFHPNFGLKKFNFGKSSAHLCMFEWVYFSAPQSKMEGNSVYQVRLNLGEYLGFEIKRTLAHKHYQDIPYDYVVPIPDSGKIAASRVAEILNIPLREALIKNRYIQRSFIAPTNEKRQNLLKLKLAPVADLITGKRLLLVDDSIVRGTTSRQIVNLLEQFSPKSIDLAVTCPPILYPCDLGINFPQRNELLSFKCSSNEEIRKSLGVQRLFYLGYESLSKSLNLSSFCHKCLSGVSHYIPNETGESHDYKIESNESGLSFWV